MISSSNRLRTSEVEKVLKYGRGLPHGAYLSAKIFHPKEESSATIRSAVVISKKVAKTAIVRNRVRRAVYDSITAASSELRAVGNISAQIVFFVRSIPEDNLRIAFVREVKKILSSLAIKH